MSITQSHGVMFEITVEILLFIVFRKEKTYAQDLIDHVVSGVSKRTVQRYLKSLEQLGYVQSDGCVHKGFTPTEKAKQTFGAKS